MKDFTMFNAAKQTNHLLIIFFVVTICVASLVPNQMLAQMQQNNGVVIPPGDNKYMVTHAELTFGLNGQFPSLPQDFFNPGSEPFTGNVILTGNQSNGGELDMPDFVIERTAGIDFPSNPSEAIVPIELVQLDLRSIAPIEVTFNNGEAPSFWDVYVLVTEASTSMIQDVHCPKDQGDH